MDRTTTPAEIAGSMESLRGLALALVRDACAADDAIQETVLRALSSPPRHGPTTGAWLRTVLKNVVRKDWQAEGRRRTRESRWQSSTPPTEPHVTLVRTEQVAALVDALRQLSPEKREAVELRYLEGLLPAAISARLGCPVETVKTRIKRGMADLRRTLDETQNPNWCAHLATSLGMAPRSVAAGGVIGSVGLSSGLGAWMLLAAALAGACVWILVASLGAEEDSVERGGPLDGGVASRVEKTRNSGNHGVPVLEPRRVGQDQDRTQPRRPPLVSEGADAGSLTISGTIVVIASGDEERRNPSGTLHLTCSGAEPREHRLPVRAGRFSVTVEKTEPDVEVSFMTLVIGDRTALIQTPEPDVSVSDGDVLAVRAHLVPDLVVKAIDADTGHDLPDVWIRRTNGQTHPGITERPTLPVACPARIVVSTRDIEDAEQLYYAVGSPGYAWSLLEVPARATGERIVGLTRGGSLELLAEGEPPSVPTRVVLQRKTGRTDGPTLQAILRAPLAPNESIRWDGLPAGDYVAWIGSGSPPARHGEAEFGIRPGMVTQTRIAYAVAPSTATVPLAGSVHVPVGWDLDKLQMKLEFLDSMAEGTKVYGERIVSYAFGRGLVRPERDERQVQFDAGLVRPGRYEAHFPHSQHRLRFRLEPDGNEALRLDLSPPATVRLRVEGDRGGAAPYLKQIGWYQETHTVSGWGYPSARRDDAEDPFELKVPQGVIVVSTTGSGFHADDTRFVVDRPVLDLTMRVRPIAHVLLSAMSGDARLPLEHEDVRAIQIGGEGSIVGSLVRDDGVLEMLVAPPGSYRFTMTADPGYEQPSPVEVDATAGAHAEGEFRLTRKR